MFFALYLVCLFVIYVFAMFFVCVLPLHMYKYILSVLIQIRSYIYNLLMFLVYIAVVNVSQVKFFFANLNKTFKLAC